MRDGTNVVLIIFVHLINVIFLLRFFLTSFDIFPNIM